MSRRPAAAALIVTLLALAASAHADPAPASRPSLPYALKPSAPKNVVEYFAHVKKQKAIDVARARANYQRLRAASSAESSDPDYPAQMQAAIARWKEVNAPDYLAKAPMGRMQVDAIGTFNIYPLRASAPTMFQVLDKDTALIQIDRVGERPGETSFVYGIYEFKGWPTSGKIDGQVLDIEDTLQITGTDTYTTADGATKTVFVFQPFDLTPYLK